MKRGRHIFVGDVHGMSGALRSLLDELNPVEGDELIFVGDLLDRGPDSVGAVSLVREMSEDGPFEVVLVEGNHEDKHRRYRLNLSVRPAVAAEQAEHSPGLAAITEALSPEDVAFLDTAVLFHRVQDHGMLVVHGGIPGDMSEFPATVEQVAALTGKAKRRASLLLRTRFVSAEGGKFLKLGAAAPGDPFWAEAYDGRFGHVVFGHEPFMNGPRLFPHATGVDTGAAMGGSLTALVVQASGEQMFVSVSTAEGTSEQVLKNKTSHTC
jgi:hypothetical protein